MAKETIQCQRCREIFERDESIWNRFDGGFVFCPNCNSSFKEWWQSIETEKRKIRARKAKQALRRLATR